jgi:cytochrome c-type biogenesis protein CcsB
MKVVKFLISPLFMGILFILFAVSMAVATFIENDFGSEASYGMIYDTRWFELIMLLLAVNLTGQIIEFKLYRKEKLSVFIFHSAFVLILIGAAITRYFGFEGSIHIREGEQEKNVFSSERYLEVRIADGNGILLGEMSEKFNLNSATTGNFKENIEVAGKNYEIILAQIIPNAKEIITESAGGRPIVSIMVATERSSGMEEISLKQGETRKVEDYSIGFDSPDSSDIKITRDGPGFFITSVNDFAEIGMMHGDSLPYKGRERAQLKTMKIFSFGSIKIIPQEMVVSGAVKPAAIDMADQETGQTALIFHVFAGEKPESLTLWLKNDEYISKETAIVDSNEVEISYGSKIVELPFALKLNDFILERYPGSNSPSGYKSDVLLIDETNRTEKPFMIFMNNILKYKGYRFYQSSFDRDEKGTILSVNHDFAGMAVTYTGYSLMILFIFLSIFNRNSLFQKINPGYWSSPFRKGASLVTLLLLLSGFGSVNAQKLITDRKASEALGKVLVQDQKGRTKPLYTLSNDILRKVTRKNDFEGLSSMQVFLGILIDFDNWQKEKIIRVSNTDLQNKVGVRGNMASFNQIVDIENGGVYKLSEDVQKAYEKAPGERNKFDKEVMKIDERVNIVYMIYSGQFMKLFPLKNDSKDWGTADEAIKSAISVEDSLYLRNIVPLLVESFRNRKVSDAIRISESISEYQSRFSEYALPSTIRTNAEVFYYKAKVFERLFPFYATVGLIMLIALISSVIRGGKEKSLFIGIFSWLLLTGFAFHTLGLALRWYVSGHSPMSNGYESMLFISWVTLMAGFIFSRKSAFALSATAVLASMTLMVAHLSFMDPEITNLVPVLKSYWLTLHVSIITGSYGFLGLGAVLGLINLILLALSDKKNFEKIGSTIDELTVINYKTLTLGLYFLTIGTFLGAVWANESWGRYWGWDPKETWSLITIIVYSLVTHSRMIPGLKDIYSFNLLSLFSFSSVLMTYFGVNYYLSGLHSYAGGDPVPVPAFVYIAIVVLAFVALMAYFRYSIWKREAEGK